MLLTDKIWAIAYIKRDFIDYVEKELNDYGYDKVEAYIPTVRLLKKKFKGKNQYEFVPMLFNYGFFKIPYKDACNPDFLKELRHRISCIYGWVKDPTKVILEDKPIFVDGALPKAAIATDEEIARLIKASDLMSVYNKEDIDKIKPGEYIKLQGYPFDNMPAEVVRINHHKKEVIVKLLMDAIVKEVTVSFENVFYSIYKSFAEDSREISLDEIGERYGNNTVDHLVFRNKYE